MSLVSILIEVLGEMMGVPMKKPQPRRRVKPATPSVSAPTSHSQAQPLDVGAGRRPDSMARAGEAALKNRKKALAEAIEQNAYLEYAAAEAATAAAVVAKQKAEAISTVSAPLVIPLTQTASHPAPRIGADLISQLRNDPEAAQAAFIYAEIFGPPLSDRRDGR